MPQLAPKPFRAWRDIGDVPGPVEVAVSHNGKTLAAGCGDGTVRFWAMPAGTPGAVPRGHTKPVVALVFTPDDRTIITASADATMRTWDAVAGKPQTTIACTAQPSSLVCSTDGKTLAAVVGKSTDIPLWDVATGKPSGALKGNPAPVSCLAVSPDGRTLASGNDAGDIKVWDFGRRVETRTITWVAGVPVPALAFMPDNRTLALAGGGPKFWDTTSGAEIRTLSVRDGARGLVFAPDGKLAVVVSGPGLWVWDCRTWQNIMMPVQTDLAGWTRAVFTPDSKLCVAASDNGKVGAWQVVAPPG
jgi:WD40 repeat protein